MESVVIDANVLVAGMRSRTGATFSLLQAILNGQVVPNLSVPLVLEYEEVLKRLLVPSLFTVDEIDDVQELGDRT